MLVNLQSKREISRHQARSRNALCKRFSKRRDRRVLLKRRRLDQELLSWKLVSKLALIAAEQAPGDLAVAERIARIVSLVGELTPLDHSSMIEWASGILQIATFRKYCAVETLVMVKVPRCQLQHVDVAAVTQSRRRERLPLLISTV